MQLSVDTVTPCLMIKNEEYWIHYVVRDLFKVFPTVLILDTGSTDRTMDIIKRTARDYSPTPGFGGLILIEDNYNNDPVRIGNGRNVMREACPTYWMFLIDGDEIWREEKLRNIFMYHTKEETEVIMVAGWNVEDVNGKLQLRTNDLANRDGLMSPNIHWQAKDYPFEGYGLVENYISKGKGMYLPAHECYAWHMRHTLRSSANWDAYFRKSKLGFYPYGHEEGQTFEDLPEGWLGEIDCQYPNPYLCTKG